VKEEGSRGKERRSDGKKIVVFAPTFQKEGSRKGTDKLIVSRSMKTNPKEKNVCERKRTDRGIGEKENLTQAGSAHLHSHERFTKGGWNSTPTKKRKDFRRIGRVLNAWKGGKVIEKQHKKVLGREIGNTPGGETYQQALGTTTLTYCGEM